MERWRAAVVISLVGLVAVLVTQLPAAGQETHIAEGDIRTSNPVIGSTEEEFASTCDHPPASQGLDGWVFELPETFGSTPVPVSLEGSQAPGGSYDLDAYFYTSKCDVIDDSSLATKTDDEAGTLPANTRFVVANLLFGANTHVTLCVGIAACPDPSASPTGTVSPTATTSPTPTDSSTPTQGPNGESVTTITSNRRQVPYLGNFTLSGRVSSENPNCRAYDEIGIRIHQRIFGESDLQHVADGVVTEDGSWSAVVRAARNASYIAEPESTETCSGVMSSPIDVLVRVDVVVGKPAKCTKAGVKGRVAPDQPSTEVLLQRKARRWITVERDTLDAQSRFALTPSKCRGGYRVLWPTQDVGNTEGAVVFRLKGRSSSRR